MNVYKKLIETLKAEALQDSNLVPLPIPKQNKNTMSCLSALLENQVESKYYLTSTLITKMLENRLGIFLTKKTLKKMDYSLLTPSQRESITSTTGLDLMESQIL